MDIFFSTSHGLYQIQDKDSGCIEEVLKKSGIPFNSVSVYGCIDVVEDGALIPALKKPMSELAEFYKKIIIRPDRNIDYETVVLGKTIISTSENAITEYTFLTQGGAEKIHKYFTESECCDYVARCVDQFFSDVEVDPARPIVVGVSGGGDSNAMLTALVRSNRVERSQIIPVMMMGIPDWDAGLDRAKTQCDILGLDLTIVDSFQVNDLLGRSHDSPDWIGDFETTFPNSDLEVIGTLAVRLALSSVVRRTRAQAAITGLNLEDTLAECLLSTIRGERPLPFPVRELDDVSFWYPLYRCPKKIIDGCHPKMSLENYGNRYPSYMYWRASLYHLAQQIGCAQVGMEFHLLDGFKKLSDKLNRKPVHRFDLGLSVAADVEDNHINKWKTFISGSRRGTLRPIP